MEQSGFIPRKIYIEKQCLPLPLTKRVLDNAGNVPAEIVDDPQGFLEERKISRDSVEHGKKDLLIARKKGEFIKPCPCTPHYIGCNYFIINLDLNCPLDCTYCILHHYLPEPIITISANHDDLWKQLDVFVQKNKGRSLRVGTGELGDSLVLDHITENSKELISHFRNNPNVLFELKTKTVNIQNIVDTEPASNIVISWSLNSSRIARSEEEGAPPVEKRIDAARRILGCGFRVGFHFDPLIHYPGCEADYKDMIEMLLERVDPAGIAWISLGSLRFPPSLHAIIQERFPETKIIHTEMIKGKDGKLRYFRLLRLEIYKNVVRFLKENGGQNIPLYLCMEGESVWREVLGWVPRHKEELEDYLSSKIGKTKV